MAFAGNSGALDQDEAARIAKIRRETRQLKINRKKPLRILSKIAVSNGCWLWTGAVTGDGYGSVWWDGAAMSAHRAVYLVLVGPIPNETLDHTCTVTTCVRPSHLEPVSAKVNLQRSWNRWTNRGARVRRERRVA